MHKQNPANPLNQIPRRGGDFYWHQVGYGSDAAYACVIIMTISVLIILRNLRVSLTTLNPTLKAAAPRLHNAANYSRHLPLLSII